MLLQHKIIARVSGFIYLILILSGFFSLLYVPSQLIEWENPMRTFKNITDNIFLYKMGVLSSIIMYFAYAFLVMSLFRLLRDVHRISAYFMLMIVMISIPISFSNLISHFNIITIIDYVDADYIDVESISVDVINLLKFHSNGISLLQIFWGLWLLPFGYLVYKSGFLPKLLGIILMVGAFGYLIDFLGYFLFPDSFSNTIIPTIASIPHAVGEIGICIWLLIYGITNNKKSSLILPKPLEL